MSNAITTAEAAQKWCPMARGTRMDLGALNGHQNDPAINTNATCRTGQCMMWRYTVTGSPPDNLKLDLARGYCGLAGSP